MIIGVTGIAQSGKDTVAQYLVENYGFTRKAFADKLKEFCYLISPELREAVDAVGWEDAKKIPVFRRLLQDAGHNARVVFGDDFWVNQVLEKRDEGYEENIVITDLRYPNEFERVNWLNGWTIRVNRPSINMVNNHITETQHLNIPVTFEVVNGTLGNLYLEIDKIMFVIDDIESGWVHD